MEGALNRIAAYAMMTGGRSTSPSSRKCGQCAARQSAAHLDRRDQTQVAEHYRIRKAEMSRPPRREVARRAKWRCIVEAVTPKSLPDIAGASAAATTRR